MTLITRSAEGWGARRVLRVDPFYVGSLWRDWSFARAARDAWRREGFDLVQSHERIPGCDVYRAGDGVHRRWLELRSAAASPLERLGIALNPYHRYVCARREGDVRAPAAARGDLQLAMVRDEIRRGFRIAPEKLHVIYNGVDLEHFHPAPARARCAAPRAPSSAAGRATRCSSSSARASRARASARRSTRSRRGERGRSGCVVVGTRPRAGAFRRQARSLGLESRVRFLGGSEDVRPLYAAADCLILPSRYDPFPNTALEALAMGLPAIVSSRCGAAEIIEPGVNGWVCEPDDAPGTRAADARRPTRRLRRGRLRAGRARDRRALRHGRDGAASSPSSTPPCGRPRERRESRAALPPPARPTCGRTRKVFALAVLGMIARRGHRAAVPGAASSRCSTAASAPAARRAGRRSLFAAAIVGIFLRARHPHLHLVVLHAAGCRASVVLDLRSGDVRPAGALADALLRRQQLRARCSPRSPTT